MKTKKIKIDKSIDEIVSIVANKTNLEIISVQDNTYHLKKSADWFKWGCKVVLKVETLKNGYHVFDVESATLLGDLFNEKSSLESEIISEILNEIKK